MGEVISITRLSISQSEALFDLHRRQCEMYCRWHGVAIDAPEPDRVEGAARSYADVAAEFRGFVSATNLTDITKSLVRCSLPEFSTQAHDTLAAGHDAVLEAVHRAYARLFRHAQFRDPKRVEYLQEFIEKYDTKGKTNEQS